MSASDHNHLERSLPATLQTQIDPLGTALIHGIAFSATIGGIGSLIGTPPNALFAGFVEQTYCITIGLARWMVFGVPIVLVLLPVTWLLLTRVFFPLSNVSPSAVRMHTLEPLSRGNQLLRGCLS